MKILEVLPTYPGDPHDGSAVYYRALNAALLRRGIQVEVLCTRARRLRHLQEFAIAWPDELPTEEVHCGIPIRRFHALNMRGVARFASDAVSRRWSREDVKEGVVVEGSSGFTSTAVAQALERPKHFDVLADVARGPVAPRLIAHLRRCARQYDVVLTGYAPFSLPRQVLAAMRRESTPVVLLPFIHENDRYHQFNSLLDTYRRAAAVLTLSPHTSQFLRECVRDSNPVAVGAGVTPPKDDDRQAGADFRARYGLEDRRVLLFVGRKEAAKQYELAASAVEMIGGDAILVMAGRDVDGKAIESERVRYLGTLSDNELAGAYEACDLFVLPSTFESFGMAFLDAWIREKPVIGNRNSGASAALIDDGVDGFLCRDANEIAVAARQLLEDADLRARLGAAGKAKTLSEFTWERVADRAIEVFQDVIRNRAGEAGPATVSRIAGANLRVSVSDRRAGVR